MLDMIKPLTKYPTCTRRDYLSKFDLLWQSNHTALVSYHCCSNIHSAIREFPHLQRSGALEKAISGLQGMSSCSTPMNMLLTVSDSYATLEQVSQGGMHVVCTSVY